MGGDRVSEVRLTDRPWRLAAVALLCALVGVLAFGLAPAWAVTSHEYLSQITEMPAKGPPPAEEPVPLPGPFSEFLGMTIDSGHLWVTDNESGNTRVDKFDAATGGFISQFAHAENGHFPEAVALGHAKGEPGPQVYLAERATGGYVVGVENESGTRQASWTGAGTPAKSISYTTDVAVDNSVSFSDWAAGDVYVPDKNNNVVDVLRREPNGEEHYVTQLPEPEPEPGVHVPFNEPRNVAVDESNGDVFVTNSGAVDEFEPTVLDQYAFVRQLKGTPAGPFGGAAGVAVDSVYGDIYVLQGLEGVVDEFSSAGVYLGHLTGTRAAGAVAVDPESHDVYVGDSDSGVDVFGPNVIRPDVTTSAASSVRSRNVTLNGTVNPLESETGEPAECWFEWGTSEALGQKAECEPPQVKGTGEMPVHAELTGLQPDTTYYYRLEASNKKNGTNSGEAFQDQHFTTAGPGIREPSAASVTSTSATLEAGIDPNSASTSYYFEYGTSASYGSSVPAPPGVSAGSGVGAVGVSVHLQGLSPGTVYHYRVVAVSEPGGESVTVESPDLTFTTQVVNTAVTSPDGREWEMVTPPDKQGAGLYGVGGSEGNDIQAAVDGGAITYVSTAPLEVNPVSSRSPESTQDLSRRVVPGGWATSDIVTAHEEGPSKPLVGSIDEYKLFSPDLSVGFVEPEGNTPLPPLPPGSEKTIYLREENGSYRALVSAENVPPGTRIGGPNEGSVQQQEGGVKFLGASPDLSHVIIESDTALEEGAPAGGGLYEWADGRLQLVSVLPHEEGGTANAFLGYNARDHGGDAQRAVSNDGSRVVWQFQKHAAGGSLEEEQLLLRDTARGETVRVDAAQNVPQPAVDAAHYWTANGEGSRVFFTSPVRLTEDSTASRVQKGLGDLYVFEVTSGPGEPLAGRVSDLTVSGNGGTAEVGGVIGASEDGTYVYFEAAGALGDAREGGANLYVEHYEEATKTWAPPRLIAALAGADQHTWSRVAGVGDLDEMTARVSPNGRYLAFMSEASLTGYENRDAVSGVRDQEVFLYDAGTGHLACASCDPTGARPQGVLEQGQIAPLWDEPKLWEGVWVAGSVPGWTTETVSASLSQSRYLSNGGRLFFDSSDALVPGDVNGQVDVYEYEPSGEGSCQPPGYGASASVVYSPGAEGCVGLVSAGTSSEESAFLDASESGGDVFFLTTSQLSPADYDKSYDIYDAHECTAVSPCAPPPLLKRPPCTTGDACKAAPTPQPELYGAPSSETFSGAGNVTPAVALPAKSKVARPKAKRARCRKRGRGCKSGKRKARKSATVRARRRG